MGGRQHRSTCSARGAAAVQARSPPDLPDLSDKERSALYACWLEHAAPAVRANTIICMIHQANYLLDKQNAALEKAFTEQGGYSEQLAAARLFIGD